MYCRRNGSKGYPRYLGEEVLETNRLTGTRHKVHRDRPRLRHDDSLAGKNSGNCKCCGGVNHKSENCRFKFSVCNACNIRAILSLFVSIHKILVSLGQERVGLIMFIPLKNVKMKLSLSHSLGLV